MAVAVTDTALLPQRTGVHGWMTVTAGFEREHSPVGQMVVGHPRHLTLPTGISQTQFR